MSEQTQMANASDEVTGKAPSTTVKACFGDVVKSTVIVASGDVHYTTIVQGREITLPTPEELAAYRAAVADHYTHRPHPAPDNRSLSRWPWQRWLKSRAALIRGRLCFWPTGISVSLSLCT